MANRTRKLVAATVAAIGTLVGMTDEAQAAKRPVVSVTFQNRTDSSPLLVEPVVAAVTRIFAATGIDLIWRNQGDEAPDIADHRITVILMAEASASLKAANPSVMGTAAEAEHRCGTIAYVFYDRIVAFAKRHVQNPQVVMAIVIAHELGHLLLPPSSHTVNGIMKAAWQPSDVLAAERGAMAFSTEQAATMRRRLAAAAVQ